MKYFLLAFVLYVVPANAVIEHPDGSATFDKAGVEWLVQMYKENQELKLQAGELKKRIKQLEGSLCI